MTISQSYHTWDNVCKVPGTEDIVKKWVVMITILNVGGPSSSLPYLGSPTPLRSKPSPRHLTTQT